MADKRPKILFIHYLRGVATCIIIICHLGVMFWFGNEGISSMFGLEPVNGAIERLPDIYVSAVRLSEKIGLNFGPFGVAIFFLISGYIIPYSIKKEGGSTKEKCVFLLKRILRIWPTYVCAFSIVFIAMFCYAKSHGRAFAYSLKDYLIQASLLRDWFWVPMMDGISWTLEVELKFYVVVFGLLLFNKLYHRKSIIGLGMTFFSFLFHTYRNVILGYNVRLYQVLSVLGDSSFLYITFMFLGLVFYNFDSGRWNWKESLITGQVLLGCFFIIMMNSTNEVLLKTYAINYLGALLLFTDFYLLRNQLRESKFLNFVADKSYAIFLLHGGGGYILLSLLCEWGINAMLALVITVGVVFAVAALFNRYVEKGIGYLTNKIITYIG